MTVEEIARVFGAKRFGRYKGRTAWRARCPLNGKRRDTLSITEPEPGRVKVNCFGGCDARDVLAAKGLHIADLYIAKEMDPALRREIEQRTWDKRRLEVLEHRHGLYIMLQAVDSVKRNYWAAAERNSAVEIRQLRDRLYPNEKIKRERDAELARIIAEYGEDELWECLPKPV